MTPSLSPVRRVVTAIGADGLSFIESDAPARAVLTHPARPGYANANLWRTTGPARIGDLDDIERHGGVMPPASGTVLRVIDFPPQSADPDVRARESKAVFDTMFADAGHQPANPRHQGMHITDTVDYAIVLEGEITAVLEKGETVLRAGDVLIQRGTNHAWANTSGRTARVAFVLIDARGSR